MKIRLFHIPEKYILLSVVLIAFVLRFWDLGKTPPSLYWDEVSQGYNAYSVLKTGFDEHHEFFPLARFQAFGDYKAPVYIYLDVIPIAVFGTTEFAVRFPSAFFGTLTVLISYLLARELFFNSDKRSAIAFISSLFLALSPWHIQLSRVAYEANVATFFTVLGVLFFFVGKRRNGYLYIPSSLSFVLAFYSFNAHRVFVPLLVLLLFALYYKSILKNIKGTVISVSLAIILLIPFLVYLRSPESRLRFQEVNIFSDVSVIKESNRLIQEDDSSFFSKIIHNRRVLFALSYTNHYFDFFNPSYLFFTGDVNPRFSTKENGELYLYMLPLIIIGMYGVIKSKGNNKYLLLGWFVLAPIAAATARETPHALRSETFIPTYEMFAGLGFLKMLEKLQKIKKLYPFAIGAIVIIMVYYLADFLHAYYVHMPQKYSQDWQYGYKQAVREVESLKNQYEKIIFSPVYGRAYIYALWYGDYAPDQLWSTGDVKRDPFGFYNVNSFGKYVFVSPSTATVSPGEHVLYVGGKGELPKNSRLLDTIYFLDGSTAFEIADNK